MKKEQVKGNANQVNPGAETSAVSPTESPQVVEKHFAHPWEKKCTTCGGENENYQGPPNVFCQGPECKGKIPMGHIDIEAVRKAPKNPDGTVTVPEVHGCPNCGSEDFGKYEAW